MKAVSLKPLKKKKIKKVKKVDTTARQNQIERQKRQRLAEAIQEEELLAEKARLAQEALDAERKLLQPQKTTSSKPATPRSVSKSGTTSSASSAGGSSSLIESQYLASILNRLHQFWALPEYLQTDPTLTAVVVITINKDGEIANKFFENKADNRVFNQFVTKTIEDATPLPPIPPALKRQRFEVGLRFRPGSIQ